MDAYDYNSLAQIEEQLATYGVTEGNDVYRAVYEYDLLGRITRTTETLKIRGRVTISVRLRVFGFAVGFGRT